MTFAAEHDGHTIGGAAIEQRLDLRDRCWQIATVVVDCPDRWFNSGARRLVRGGWYQLFNGSHYVVADLYSERTVRHKRIGTCLLVENEQWVAKLRSQ